MALCLPRKRSATSLATRPSTLSVASSTNHSRFNYGKYGAVIGLGDRLLSNPELASDPDTAAKLLAAFLKDKQQPIQEALLEGDLKTARRLVNGGTNGLDRFSEAYTTGQVLVA